MLREKLKQFHWDYIMGRYNTTNMNLEKQCYFKADHSLGIFIEELDGIDIPDPDPHNYEGEWEAMLAGKESAIQAMKDKIVGGKDV